MIGAILKLIGVLALMGLSFGAGILYQRNQTIQKAVNQKVQQQVDRVVEKLK